MVSRAQIKIIDEVPPAMAEKYVNEIAPHVHDKKDDLLKDVAKSNLKVGAFIDGRLIGFACGHARPSETPEMGSGTVPVALFTEPEFRRKGIARRLTWRLVGELRARGINMSYSTAMVPPARGFFKKMLANCNSPYDPPRGVVDEFASVWFGRTPKKRSSTTVSLRAADETGRGHISAFIRTREIKPGIRRR